MSFFWWVPSRYAHPQAGPDWHCFPLWNRIEAALFPYHALVIPSLGDEQPRILFDASARTVASLASDTDGLRAHVEHGKTGWMLTVGNPEAWATAIERLSADAPLLRNMGMAAPPCHRRLYPPAMHRTRSHILRQHFA